MLIFILFLNPFIKRESEIRNLFPLLTSYIKCNIPKSHINKNLFKFKIHFKNSFLKSNFKIFELIFFCKKNQSLLHAPVHVMAYQFVLARKAHKLILPTPNYELASHLGLLIPNEYKQTKQAHTATPHSLWFH